MFTRKLSLVLAILVGNLFVVSIVSADTLSGTGQVHAQGNGTVVMRGDVKMLHIQGRGSLFFKDSGDVDEPVVTGTGHRIDLPNGWVQYIGFNGTFHLSVADDVIVKLDGRNINLFVEGRYCASRIILINGGIQMSISVFVQTLRANSSFFLRRSYSTFK